MQLVMQQKKQICNNMQQLCNNYATKKTNMQQLCNKKNKYAAIMQQKKQTNKQISHQKLKSNHKMV